MFPQIRILCFYGSQLVTALVDNNIGRMQNRVIDNVGWNRAVCPVTRLNIVYSTFQSAASRELSGGYPFGAD